MYSTLIENKLEWTGSYRISELACEEEVIKNIVYL